MRVTHNMLVRSQMATLQTQNAALERAQSQVSTGKKVHTSSDDPAGAAGIMTSNGSIRAIDQYRRNVEGASSRVATEDTVLGQLTSALTRAKELGMSQASDVASDATRAAASAELQQLFTHVVTLGNTRFGDEYLFGGEQSTTQPFAVQGSGASLAYSAPTLAADQRPRQVQLGANQTVTPNHDGKQLLLDSGILDAIGDLARANAPDFVGDAHAANAAAMRKLDDAFDRLQGMSAETGARGNALQMTSTNLDAFESNVRAYKSDLEDVDFEQAATELVAKQTAFQGAMLATSKILSLNLADYLR